MATEQPQSPSRPNLEVPAIELRDFKGLCIKPDIVNRPPNSWRRLDNFDLYIPGSIRKVAAPAVVNSSAFPVVILATAEFKANDQSAEKSYGVGTDGKIYDLSAPLTAGISLGVGSISQPMWMGLLPGTEIPYEFIQWQKSLAVTAGEAVTAWALDGNKYIFECTTLGNTSATAPPAWPTSGTISDGTVTWTNRGLQDQATYQQNYLVIIIQGQQPLKFDGTNVTPVGVSAPTVPINIDQVVQTSVATSGFNFVTGRYYSYTWFNPATLHESAPAPIVGTFQATVASPSYRGTPTPGITNIPFVAADDGDTTFKARGSFIGPTLDGTFYLSIGLTIPQAALTPPIGSGYTHLRFYATQDGGSQLFLLQTLYDVSGDQLCDANGAVAIAQLGTEQGYEAVPITQSLATQVIVYDGIDTGNSQVSQDSQPANNDLFTEGNVTYIATTTGTLTVDTDLAVILYPRGGFLATSGSYAASQGTNWSLEVRFRAKANNGGGVLASFSASQKYSTTAMLDRVLFMNAAGKISFAYLDASTGAWVEIRSSANGWNDGNNHSVDIIASSGGGVDMYIDGVHQSNATNNNNPAFIGYWRFGLAELSVHPAIPNTANVPEHWQGVLDEIVFWETTAISSTVPASNASAAALNANYASVIQGETPTNYWRLDDLGSVIAQPTNDAALVYPAPALTDHYPPPVGRWGAIFQSSLVIQDDTDGATIWPSDTGDFESFGQFQFTRFQTEQDDDVVSLVGGLNLLVVGTSRRVDSLQGADVTSFQRQPIDDLHGFLGHRCVFPLGSKIVGLMRQGLASYDLTMSFGATSGNVQLGYGDATLIGDDILPILQQISMSDALYLVCIAVDNTQNILLFAIKDANGKTYNDVILMFTMGQSPGWSRFLPPNSLEYPSIKEMLLYDGTIDIIATASDKNVYKLFNTQAPASPLVAVAETQALPTTQQMGYDLWDTDRDFLYMYVEGQDLANFTYQFATDYPNNSAFTPAIPLKAGKNLLGGSGKQIVVRLTHAVNPTNAPALISYIKIGYTVGGRTS